MVKVISYIYAECFELTKAFDYRIIAVNICLCFLYKCGYLHVFFLVMPKHANPWPTHAMDAKKYLHKATFLRDIKKYVKKTLTSVKNVIKSSH